MDQYLAQNVIGYERLPGPALKAQAEGETARDAAHAAQQRLEMRAYDRGADILVGIRTSPPVLVDGKWRAFLKGYPARRART